MVLWLPGVMWQLGLIVPHSTILQNRLSWDYWRQLLGFAEMKRRNFGKWQSHMILLCGWMHRVRCFGIIILRRYHLLALAGIQNILLREKMNWRSRKVI